MNDADKFADYLQNTIAVLNEETGQAYRSLVNGFDKERVGSTATEATADPAETKLIFCLADLLKNLDAGRYYDMAERIYYRWRLVANEELERKLEKLCQTLSQKLTREATVAFHTLGYESKIKDMGIEKEKLQAYLDSTIKENEILDQLRQQYPAREPESSPPPPIDNNDNMAENKPKPTAAQDSTARSAQSKKGAAGESIFDKLHGEAMTKLEIKQLNEEIRKRREVQYCTFKPEVPGTEPLPSGREESKKDVYERLAHSNKQQKTQYYDAQKAAKEMRHCTFQPDLPKAKRDLSQSHAGNRSLELSGTAKIHERLHKEAETLVQTRQCQQFASREKELDGCTFTPTINSRRMSAQGISAAAKRFDELYNDNERKKRQQSKDEVAKEERELGKCTFKPCLLSKNTSKPTLVEDLPHYEKLYTKHSQKQVMLEQKRKELIEEEKKMRQFVALGTKKSAKTSLGNTSAVVSSSSKVLVAEPVKQGAAFNRLYGMDKVYRQNKQVLSRKIMKETGISFTPRTNAKPFIFTDQEPTAGVIQRNEEFLRAKNSKIAHQLPSEMKECTFAPQVHGGGKSNSKAPPFSERLYAYFDVYEKRKEEYRQKHPSD